VAVALAAPPSAGAPSLGAKSVSNPASAPPAAAQSPETRPTNSKPAQAKGSLPGANLVTVTAANPSAFARTRETVVLLGSELAKLVPSLEIKKALVVDAVGRPVVSQLVDMNGDDEPDELVFQVDLAAGQAKRFNLRLGERQPLAAREYKVYARFVRERHDDFAWENDLVAHRMYGPELETWAKDSLVSSGIDTWAKRTHELVVNEWYMTDDYHRDNGQGADFYGVGKSRGCGGLGIWANGKLYPSRNFVRSRVLANGPIRLVFELTYAPWEIPGGAHISETKRVVLDAGTAFNRFESTFSGGKGALAVAVGIAKHAGSALRVHAGSSSMSVWEPVKDAQGSVSGNLGCAVVLSAGAGLEAQASDLDYLAVTSTDAAERIVYRAGSTWDRAGQVRDLDAWAKTVENVAAKAAAPLQVQLAPLATN